MFIFKKLVKCFKRIYFYTMDLFGIKGKKEKDNFLSKLYNKLIKRFKTKKVDGFSRLKLIAMIKIREVRKLRWKEYDLCMDNEETVHCLNYRVFNTSVNH